MIIKRFPGERSIVSSNNGDVDGELFRQEGVEKTYQDLVKVPVAISKIDLVVVTKNKKFVIDGWNSLRYYKVGYVRGIKVIENNLIYGTVSEPVTGLEQAYKMLDAGRIDVIIDVRTNVKDSVQKFGISGVKILEPAIIKIPVFHYINNSSFAVDIKCKYIKA